MSSLPKPTMRREPLVPAYHALQRAQPEIDAPEVITSPGVPTGHARLPARRAYRFITAGQLVDETGGAPPGGTALLTFPAPATAAEPPLHGRCL